MRAVDPTLNLDFCVDPLGRLFFSAVEDNPARLWLSDGTVTDLPPAHVMPVHNGNSNPGEFLSVGATAYFVPNQDSSQGGRIFRTDGTPAGTREVIPLPGASSYGGGPSGLTLFNGKLWFKLDSSLYVGDPETGTATSMQMGAQSLYDFKPAGTRLVGLWRESPYSQLWTHTGSATGSTLFASHYDSSSTMLSRLFPVGNSLLYAYVNSSTGYWEVRRTNATSSSTVRVAQLPVRPESFTSTGNLTFFVAGGMVNRADATAAVCEAMTATLGREPEDLQAAGGLLFFTGAADIGREPWMSDGTQTGTHRIADFQPGAGSSTLVAAALHHGTPYLLLRNWEGTFLVRTDGTEAGTVKVAEAPGATWLVSRGGALLFN